MAYSTIILMSGIHCRRACRRNRGPSASARPPGLPGGRLRARPAARPRAAGLRRRHRRAARASRAPVPRRPAGGRALRRGAGLHATATKSKWPPSAAITPTATGATRQRRVRNRSPRRTSLRRDFTINGLLHGPAQRAKCWTSWAGRRDLEARPDPRHRRPRRPLRARTTCGCCAPSASPPASDFEIEPGTFDAIRRLRADDPASLGASASATSWRAS